jgi:sugar phosphate isomerase/epimerase
MTYRAEPYAISRRAFVGALGAAGLAGFGQNAGGYRLGLETWCFHDVSLDAMLKNTRDLGLRYLELHDGHLPRDSSDAQIAAAQRALNEAGMTATGIYIHDAFTTDESVARPILQFAKRMGFRYVNGGPRREALPLLNRIAPEYGVQIAIHNHGPKARYDTLVDVTTALEGHANLVPCIDIGHFARSHVDPVNATRVLGARAVAIHIKDVDAKGENAVVGEGTIDVPGVFRAMRESGFKGLVVLEYEGDFDNMPKRLAGMRKSLQTIRRILA